MISHAHPAPPRPPHRPRGDRRLGQDDPGPGPSPAPPPPRPQGRLLPRADAGTLGPGDQAAGGPGRFADAGRAAGPFRQGPARERGPEPQARPGRRQGRRPRPLLLLDHRLPGGQGPRPRADPPHQRGLRRPARPGRHPRRRRGGGPGPHRRPEDPRRALRARGLTLSASPASSAASPAPASSTSTAGATSGPSAGPSGAASSPFCERGHVPEGHVPGPSFVIPGSFCYDGVLSP